MTSQEKDRLLTLLLDARHWCQTVEARAADGQAVTYSDPQAAAWDLTGAVCRLFGWRRACELFIQMDRRLHPRSGAEPAASDPAMVAMISLQSWNDDPHRSHPELVAFLEQLPVSHRAAGCGPLLAAPDSVPSSELGSVESSELSGLSSHGPDGSRP
jgi:hypothetical protein